MLRKPDAATELLGSSDAMHEIRSTIALIADAQDPVLITGDTGVGKEAVARALHAASHRRAEPFVAVNASAVSDGLLESELFGHERGAFTGATAMRRGRFEQAHEGSLLLDEIGDAGSRLQAELLRVVETQCFERLGGERAVRVDVRVLASTHRDLAAEAGAGRFREDLWYRLSAFHIHVPPLRDRPLDVDDLARSELDRLSVERGFPPFELDEGGYALLRSQQWPGNVRQLLLTVRRMAVLAGERRQVDSRDVERSQSLWSPVTTKGPPKRAPAPFGHAPGSRLEYRDRERNEILGVLTSNRWNVAGAARSLGLSRGGLRNRMRRLGITG